MDVNHIAKLANLTITNDEATKYEIQLTSILGLVDQLKKVDSKNVEPTYQVTGQKNCWREDEIDSDRMLQLDAKYFKIPKIL